MENGWLVLSICLMILNWRAVQKQTRGLDIFTKSLPVLALASWFAYVTGLSGDAIWFFTALLSSAIGDFLLLFRGFFIPGLAAFFIAHCFFVAGFSFQIHTFGIPGYIILIIFSTLWIFLFSTIRKAINRQPTQRKMILPVAAYSLILCMMSYSACLTLFQSNWPPLASTLAAIGAILFLFSDFLLAFDRFVKPMPTARLWKRMTYQLGQLAIAASAALYFSGGLHLI